MKTGARVKKVRTSVKKTLPIISRRSAVVASLADSSRKRAVSSSWRPKTLLSSTPETDSVSSVIAVIAAVDSWAWRATSRRRSPTRRASRTKTGMMATDSRVRGTLRNSIATTADSTVTTVDRTVEAVLVTTPETAVTSLDSRDWISPVRVPVKNDSGSSRRWAYRSSRSSRITFWPTSVAR